MVRQTHYAESLTESSTTSATWQEKLALAFTGDANADYWIFATGRIRNSSNAADTGFRLRDHTGSVTYQAANVEMDTDERIICSGLGKFSAGASPSENTFKVEFNEETTATAYIQDATLLAMKAGDDDEYAESLGESTTTSTSPQTKVTLSFTPGTTQNYLVFAYFDVRCDAGSRAVEVDFTVDGTNVLVDNEFQEPRDATTWLACGVCYVKSLASGGSRTTTLTYHTEQAGETARIRNARILAIPIGAFSDFANAYADYALQTSTTSGSYVDTDISITQTPNNEQHVLFAAALTTNNNVNAIGYWRYVHEGSTLFESIYDNPASGTNHSCGVWCCPYRWTPTASSKTWKYQHHRGASGTHWTLKQQLVVLEVGEDAGSEVAASWSEGAKAGDTFSAVKTVPGAITEGAKAGDTQDESAILLASISEGAKAGDTESVSAVLTASLSEGAKAGDPATVTGALIASVTEGAKAGDTQAASAQLFASVADGAKAGDSLTAGIMFPVSISEGAKAGDSLGVTSVYVGIFTEGAKAGDACSNTAALVVAWTEGAQAGDNLSLTAALVATWSEGAKSGIPLRQSLSDWDLT